MSRRGEPGRVTELLGRLVAQRTDHARLVRGKELADLGRVRNLELSPGRATASVGGSRDEPYDVTVRVARLGPPVHADELEITCTCPDWGDPCKHGVAVVLAIAQRFDADPAKAQAWWGDDDDDGSPSGQLSRDGSGASGGSERLLGPGLKLPMSADRPAWADLVVARPAPATLDDWLGGRPAAGKPPARTTSSMDGDVLGAVLDLGRLEVGDGWDLAPAVHLLLLALLDG